MYVVYIYIWVQVLNLLFFPPQNMYYNAITQIQHTQLLGPCTAVGYRNSLIRGLVHILKLCTTLHLHFRYRTKPTLFERTLSCGLTDTIGKFTVRSFGEQDSSFDLLSVSLPCTGAVYWCLQIEVSWVAASSF